MKPFVKSEELTEKQKYDKQNYLNNKERKLEQQRKYKETNKEKIFEYEKQRKETRKIKVVCVCGCSIQNGDISKHIKTQKHFNLMNKLNDTSNNIEVVPEES